MTSYRRVSRAAGGFTTIELLIVIAVIAVLSAMLLMGLRAITRSSKEQATKVVLGQLRGILGEFESTVRYSKEPPMWGWYNGSARVTVLAADREFWRYPFEVDNGANGEQFPDPPGVGPAPLDAPGDVASSSGHPADKQNSVRNGSRQVLNTQLAMNFLMSVPANRSAVQGMQSDRFFTPQWADTSQGAELMIPCPGPDRVLKTDDDTTEQVYYYVGNRVVHNGKTYRCTGEHVASTPPPGGFWQEEGLETGPNAIKSVATVMLMDAWDNPIIFVPASGLRVRKLNGKEALDPSKKFQTFVIVSPEGTTQAPNESADTKGRLIRPGKPFFASAGPDGDFSTGEDNIYSFEE